MRPAVDRGLRPEPRSHLEWEDISRISASCLLQIRVRVLIKIEVCVPVCHRPSRTLLLKVQLRIIHIKLSSSRGSRESDLSTQVILAALL